MLTVAEQVERKKTRPRGGKDTSPCPHCKNDITLVGTKEATRLLGTNTSTWQSWRERPDFPEPAFVVGQGGLWHKSELLEWNRQREFKKGEKVIPEVRHYLESLDEDQREQAVRQLLEGLSEKERRRWMGR